MDSIKKMNLDIQNVIVFEIVKKHQNSNTPITYVGILYWIRHSKYYHLVTLQDIKMIYRKCLKILPNKIESKFIL